ncbi:MAG: NAD(+)/NADH kinase [Planctomycetes bacterium]|nr:NAD(+)/NADH kinase [Planctomycetota bacterium]
MKRLGLFGWLAREGVRETVARHKAALEKDHHIEVFDFGAPLPEEAAIDLGITFGGDGTILYAAGYLAPRGIPAVGLNLGKFGFLAGCNSVQCGRIVRAALSGEIKPVVRTMLSCVLGCGDEREELIALNDIAVTSSVATHMIGMKISINGIDVSSFQGDGLIVATATGSTAYNLSSGGPLVAPTEDVIILTGLAPHTLSIRPMVISGGDVVDVEVSGRPSGISVTADGRIARNISSGDTVRLKRAPFRFHLYESEDWSFYRVVRSKLGWGEEPNYAKSGD